MFAKSKKTSKSSFKYIYGPVPSWRLGSSLGVDLLSGKDKFCTFDCIYCQLGRTKVLTAKRRLYVSTAEVLAEIKALPNIHIDYITFSGRGEPTLALNLGKTIKAIKRLRREPIAVLTNASLLNRKDVRKELSEADFVLAKLDADSQALLKRINRPAKKISFTGILKGIKQFRKEYQGKLALQMMFMRANKGSVKNMARLARDIRPDEVQIGTPVRPCAIKPLSRSAITEIKKYFVGIKVISLYDVRRVSVQPINVKDTASRRGEFLE